MIDTNVAIYLRDKRSAIIDRVAQLTETPFIAMITRIELENGVHADPEMSDLRLGRLETMLATLPCLDFDSRAADVFRQIIDKCGYSRVRTFDRMIAAQAIVAGATLITINGADFRNIPGLTLEIWPDPA